MLYYWYQPLITLNKPEIQRFCLSYFELDQRCIITEQLLHEAEYDMSHGKVTGNNSIKEQIQKKVAKIMRSLLTR